jgi:hypothetical protein
VGGLVQGGECGGFEFVRGKTKGFIKTKSLGRIGGWADGWVRCGRESGQGGSIGL